MGQASKYLRRWQHMGEGGYSFFCPGCNEAHAVKTDGAGAWGFNSNVDRPTFTPSVLLRSGHYAPSHMQGTSCWCTFNADRVAKGDEPSKFKCTVCHSFVTDGQIQFLTDCTHQFAGKTVPLPELPEYLRD